MPRPRYTDKYDDPLYDPTDDAYGDYDPDTGLEGFSITTLLDDPEEDEDL